MDISISTLSPKQIDDLAGDAGLYRPFPVHDPVHFQLVGTAKHATAHFILHSPINILITDPEGREFGTDPATGAFINQIDPLATDTGAGTEPRVFTIPEGDLLPGAYQIAGIGTGAGPYTIEVQLTADDDLQDVLYDQIIATGTASPGQTLAAISPFNLLTEASAPSIVSITSSTPDGVFGVGSPIEVTVTLSKPATLAGGDLAIPFNDGGSLTIAPFSGLTILTGTYTVTFGDEANRLDTTSPLLLAAGATLTDADGNDAALAILAGASLANSSDFVINTTPPTLVVELIGPGSTAPDTKDGPRVIQLERFGYHWMPTILVLTANQALDPATAQDPNIYRIITPRGKTIHVKSAVYNPNAHTVTLHPTRRVNIHYRYEVIVNGSMPGGLADKQGQLLDGTDSGKPGSDYRAPLNWRNLRIGPLTDKTPPSTKTTTRRMRVQPRSADNSIGHEAGFFTRSRHGGHSPFPDKPIVPKKN